MRKSIFLCLSDDFELDSLRLRFLVLQQCEFHGQVLQKTQNPQFSVFPLDYAKVSIVEKNIIILKQKKLLHPLKCTLNPALFVVEQ